MLLLLMLLHAAACMHACMLLPQVFLDGVLPQLLQLAGTDGRRSNRVAAIEALHSIALWMVGDVANSQARGEDGRRG